ncbi:MAG: von Willebrand factor type A domain-containing protein, partial [Clostridiales bacterium]|nr:von Willebrand factor type A domain-containing protein [Clostridiales bacterium]
MKKQLLYTAVILCMLMILSACSAASSEAPSNDVPSSEEPIEEYAPAEEASTAPMPNGDPLANESYLVIDENAVKSVNEESMLTFSLKVDTASYDNVVRYIESGNIPPHDAIRTEELINYFTYDNDMPFTREHPFSISTEVGPSPFDSDKYMAFIRVKSEDIDSSELPPSNLTFLIDTSGSMESYDKLPLLKQAFGLLTETLDEYDRVSIVTYAGSSAVVLDGATGDNKDAILSAINKLNASGSTAGAEGIMTAYALAEKNFLEDGNNRVILATDGDFNVGTSSVEDLAELIGEKRGNNVYMSIIGFGTGNIRDDIMETLSKEGNGNYSYIHDISGAQKVLVDELAANLYTIADDVKAQVEFNPQNVRSYRLVGYENRRLNNEDFEDDTKDAGEIGVGTDVVVMFELELNVGADTDGRKYSSGETKEPDFSNELFEVRLRYKDPGESESKLISQPVFFDDIVDTGSSDYRFACSVAAFGHLLRDSEYKGDVAIDDILTLAENSLGTDDNGYRR